MSEESLMVITGEWKSDEKGETYFMQIRCDWPHRDSSFAIPYDNKEKALDDLGALLRNLRYRGLS